MFCEKLLDAADGGASWLAQLRAASLRVCAHSGCRSAVLLCNMARYNMARLCNMARCNMARLCNMARYNMDRLAAAARQRCRPSALD